MSRNTAAWITEAKANPLKVAEAEMWKPGPDEILVKNAAVAINPIDWIVQDVAYGITKYPTILGNDIAGEVAEIGSNVTRFKVGQRVIAHSLVLRDSEPAHGAFQKYTVVEERLAAALPASVGFEQGAVLPLALSTAADGLYAKDLIDLPFPTVAPKKTGKTILIWAGSTSVGSVAIQLAVASGVDVVTTASARNHDYVKALGAVAVVDHTGPKVVDEAVKALEAQGGDFVGIFDSYSKEGSIKLAAEVGRRMGGCKIALTLPDDNGVLSGTVSGRNVYAPTFSEKSPQVAEAVWGKFVSPALASGALQAKPESLIVSGGLEKTQEALEKHKAGVSAAKVVLKI